MYLSANRSALQPLSPERMFCAEHWATGATFAGYATGAAADGGRVQGRLAWLRAAGIRLLGGGVCSGGECDQGASVIKSLITLAPGRNCR